MCGDVAASIYPVDCIRRQVGDLALDQRRFKDGSHKHLAGEGQVVVWEQRLSHLLSLPVSAGSERKRGEEILAECECCEPSVCHLPQSTRRRQQCCHRQRSARRCHRSPLRARLSFRDECSFWEHVRAAQRGCARDGTVSSGAGDQSRWCACRRTRPGSSSSALSPVRNTVQPDRGGLVPAYRNICGIPLGPRKPTSSLRASWTSRRSSVRIP